jgi:hypothetical protein
MIVGRLVSLEGGLASLLHGPGESPNNNGEGKGVRSPIAAMTGLGTAELQADPILLWKARLTDGVLDTRRLADEDLCARRFDDELRP